MELTNNELITEHTNQHAFVMYYRSDANIKDVRRLPIKVTYVSKKMQAIYFYTDEKLVMQINSMIKKIRGIINFEKAPLFDATLNF